MFSSNDLINLVFADESDIYYTNGLLKLSLDQYLWLKLHDNYSAVYFLSRNGYSFSVKTFGDKACKSYEDSYSGFEAFKSFIVGKTEAEKFCGWLSKQMRSKQPDTVAFVCSLEDFCAVFSQPEWAEQLRGIRNESIGRTGSFIIKCPATAEQSLGPLLTSSAFVAANDTAILETRNADLVDFYGAIYQKKGSEACIFLNSFSCDSVRAIILHSIFDSTDRFLDEKEINAVSRFLTFYLKDVSMQHDLSIFGSPVHASMLRNRDLYDLLKNNDVWMRLLNAANTANDLVLHPPSDFYISRDKNCFAGRCLALRIPDAIIDAEVGDEHALDVLRYIHIELISPKNKVANDVIQTEANNFFNMLPFGQVIGDKTYHADDRTYRRILNAIYFCVSWLYTSADSLEYPRVIDVIKYFKRDINTSQSLYQLERNVFITELSGKIGTLTNKSLTQMKEQADNLRCCYVRSEDLISSYILNLKMEKYAVDIAGQLKTLYEKIDTLDSAPLPVEEEKAQQVPNVQPQSEPQPDDPSKYTLDPLCYTD